MNERDDQITETKGPESQLPPEPSSLATNTDMQKIYAALRDDMDLGEDDEEMDSDEDDDDEIPEDFMGDDDGEEDSPPQFDINIENPYNGQSALTDQFSQAIDTDSKHLIDSLNDRVTEGSFNRNRQQQEEVGNSRPLGQEVEGGAVTSSPKGTPGSRGKKKVKFENKSVRFDENTAIPSSIHRPMSANKASQNKNQFQQQQNIEATNGARIHGSAPMSSTQTLLELEKEIKIHQSEGNFSERNKNLLRYCRMANETAQSVDLKDQKKALTLLQQCVKIIKDNATKQTPFDELLYETYNNIARCYNILGDIEASLEYLLKAYNHALNLAQEREVGSVTILPELSLNICNAQIYEMNYQEANRFATEAVRTSSQCIIKLTQKLDQPISDDPIIKVEQERLSELYKSQVKLHIQGYQARGRIYEKMNKFKDAIREYTKAKKVVEQNFGTNNDLFKDAVAQVTAANVNLKTQSYTGRIDGGGKFSNAASMSSSWSTGKKSRKSQKKDPSPDRDVVQITDDVIDIRSMDKSDFDQQSLLQNSVQTEQAAKDTGGQLISNKISRKLRSARGKKSKEVILKKGSSRPKRKSTTRLTTVEYAKKGIQPIIRQPPFNTGSPHLGYNQINHWQSMIRNNDLWKFNHYYTPNMIGYLGYHSHNLERPRSFYHTSIKLNHRPLRRPSTPRLRIKPKYQRAIKTIVKIEKPTIASSDPVQAASTATNSSQELKISQEIEDLKEKLRNKTSSSELGLNEAVRNIQERQVEQRRNLMDAIEQQKQELIERQRREREQARAEREAIMIKIQAQSQQQMMQQQQLAEKKKKKSVEKKVKKEKEVEVKQQPPQVQVPPVHPIYGPAVYDSVRNQWTYPYAQWYGPGGMQQEEDEVEVIEEQEPEPQREDFSVQKDFEVKQKPVMSTSAIQTEDEVKIEHHEIALQTMPLEQVDFGTSPRKDSPKSEEKKPKKNYGESQARENGAASTIQKYYKKRIQNRRELSFNTREQGMLFTRKRKFNQLLGAIEIMSMYVVGTMENRCKCLRFTIFNYATKQFSYLGVYDKLSHLEEFDLNVLFELSRPSLEDIVFERSPFRFHILCMQSIIKTSRQVQKPLKEVKLVDEKEVKVKKEPEVIVIEPTKPEQTEIGTQMEPPTEDWILEAEVNDVEENEVVDDDMIDKDPLVFKTETQWKRVVPEKQPEDNLYKPKARPTIEPKIIRIQRWIRKQLFRQKLRILMMVKQRDSKRLLFSHMRKIDTQKFGTKYFTVSLFKKTQTSKDGVPVAQKDGGYQLEDDNKVSEIYILEAREQLDPQQQDSLKKQKLQSCITIYNDIRLPDDQSILKYYLLSGTILTIDEDTGVVDSLKLVRLKIKLCWAVPIYRNNYYQPELVPIDVIGCNIKIQFLLNNYPGHLCKVYKRLRYEDPEKREGLIKDWKIKVIQLDAPHSEDYIIVRRLPCRISDVEKVIQQTLEVRHNKRIVPCTILHLMWTLNNITIYSQKFYDFNQPRFIYEHVGTYYFQQAIGSNRRIPEDFQIENKRWDPLYEVYIQKMVPKFPKVSPYRYAAPAYLQRKNDRKMNKKHLKKKKSVIIESFESDSSASEDDNDAKKYVDDECFWDEQEIVRMQLDECHAAQQYYKVTVTKSIDKQDQDFFRIECDVAHWPHSDVEFQYLMENLLLKQKKNAATGEVNIKTAGLKIRNIEYRYASDTNWVSYTRSTGGLEFFMSQDQTRWRNQNFSCTVYNTRNHGGGFLFEVVNVDKPFQRAYERVPTLMGMRGQILKFYIDSQLKIVGQKDQADLIVDKNTANYDQSIGFGDEHVIESILFACTPEQFRKRMSIDQNYCMWQYEKLGDEEKQAGFEEPERGSYDPEEAAREQQHQQKLKALKDKARVQKAKLDSGRQNLGIKESM